MSKPVEMPGTSASAIKKLSEIAEGFAADRLIPVEPTTAREINGSRPFSTRKIIPASAFNSRLTGDDRERATACLATAALYEAGGNADDQRPVIQVILNRVRHPAWPSSVCGVVFQGVERRTGCQFSFTCDGSMSRWRPSAANFNRARELASAMMAEQTDPRVGWATHYHTDWVVPYWSDSLDKTAAVKTHLFFRWKGRWGTGPTFKAGAATTEPKIRKLAASYPVHATSVEDSENLLETLVADALPASVVPVVPGNIPATAAPANAKPIVRQLSAGMQPGRWALDAVTLCGKKAECRVVGWAPGSQAPLVLDRDGLMALPPDIVYVQKLRDRTQQVYWNCDKWPLASTSRCLGTPAASAALALTAR